MTGWTLSGRQEPNRGLSAANGLSVSGSRDILVDGVTIPGLMFGNGGPAVAE